MPSITRDELIRRLQTDAPTAALGLLMLAAGIGVLILYRLRARGKDPLLFWFGLFMCPYAIRLLLNSHLVRLTVGLSDSMGRYMTNGLTYVIPIPAMFFLVLVFPTWEPVLRWVIRGSIVFAAAGIASDILMGQPGFLNSVNNVIVLAAVLVFVYALFRRRTTLTERALRVGLIALVLPVIFSNLRGIFIPTSTIDFEPFGFAVFMGALGLVVARRAIDDSERLVEIEKELEIAKRIQISILPREMPRTENLHIAARYLPMTAVAGDFYDFLPVDEHRVGILVADVSGHGVPAALIASMVKVAIAAQLPHASEPAKVLAGMNETLSGKLQGQFVTAAYLFLDLEAGRVRYSAAGHPPMLWWRSDLQRVDAIEQNGLVLGLFARAPYTAREEEIRRGDRFLLYTDGIVEATNGTEEFFGQDRLTASIVDSKSLDSDAAISQILDKLSSWSRRVGTDQEDDLTLLCVDTVPGA